MRNRRPLFSASVGADATPAASARCPTCGGELRFESDRLGYGQTIEQCENVLACGHFRTLE